MCCDVCFNTHCQSACTYYLTSKVTSGAEGQIRVRIKFPADENQPI